MDSKNVTILLVDDKQQNLKLHEKILEPDGYRILTASNGNEGLAVATRESPDMVLLDIMMPAGMNGYAVAKNLKSNPATGHIPIIIITSLDDQDSKLIGLDTGAEEYLTKPVDGEELRMRVRNLLRIKEYTDLIDKDNRILEQRVEQRTAELHGSHIETIYALTRAAEHRDDDTGAHVQRISHYTRSLAETIGMDSDYCELIHYASPMHDIGKIGIPDHILLKPSAHTAEEFAIMKSHCALGADILLGCKSPFLKMGTEIALSHHERWDGTGYPNGLSGDAIPLSARIMSLCDIYDALRSKRPYKPAFDHDRAIRIVVDGDGRTQPEHFDPAVLDSFKQCAHRLNEIHNDLVMQRPIPA